jgi:mRNA interferase RelE/StbE
MAALERLPTKLGQRILKKLQASKKNPFFFFERLSVRVEYKLRVGDYRVIADIDKGTIRVLHVGHRKNVYSRGRLS